MLYALIAYGIFLLIYAIFSVVILYHLFRFGYRESASSIMIVTYIGISIGIIVLTFILFTASGAGLTSPIDVGL